MDLNFQIDGPENAPVIVLSNSLGTTLSMWEPQVQALRAQFRVVRYDTHGHGQSRQTGATSIEQLGRDVIALLDHLDIEKAHFCGISMGGLTGLWLARYHSQRILSVAVINSAAKIGDEAGWLSRAKKVREQGMGEIAASAPARWFTPAFRHASPQTVAALCLQLTHTSAEGYAACCEALAKADLREVIAAIAVPVLLIAGEDDPVTTVADAQYLHRHIAGSSLVTVKASHLSSIEAPGIINGALLSFLGEHYAR